MLDGGFFEMLTSIRINTGPEHEILGSCAEYCIKSKAGFTDEQASQTSYWSRRVIDFGWYMVVDLLFIWMACDWSGMGETFRIINIIGDATLQPQIIK